jgi:multiple sugar transport system permease protein
MADTVITARARPAAPRRLGMRASETLWNALRFVILAAGAATMVLPLLWMATCALKTNAAIFAVPPQWIPREFAWSNFVTGTAQIKFWSRLANTLVITSLSTVGQILSCTLVGYALARLRFPGRRLWFYLVVGSMMLPGMVSLIPVFRVFTAIGWYNTWLPLILPNFLGAPFFIFLIRQYLCTVPRSFDEAARIDGAGYAATLRRILVPMIRPALVVVVIMQVQASWNDYLNPLVYLIKPELWTLSLAVASYITLYAVEWNKFMAADIVFLLPMLALYFAAQRFYMQGLGSLNAAGLK